MNCEQCGSELKNFKEGSAQGLRCANCGWSIVTTNLSGIKLDEAKYEVSCSANYHDEAHVRAVSEVTGYNFLMSRKALQKGRFTVFNGQAVEVLRIRNILISAGLECVIDPDFKWN